MGRPPARAQLKDLSLIGLDFSLELTGFESSLRL